MPDERWLASIEPSVAIRGHRACIAIATIADETDVALDALAVPGPVVDVLRDALLDLQERMNRLFDDTLARERIEEPAT